MSTWMRMLLALGVGALVASCASRGGPDVAPANGGHGERVEFSAGEKHIILGMSPLPAPPPDPTNRYADDPAAARFGQFIFFDPRFSGNGKVSCASCHDPAKNWTDGQRVPEQFSADLRHVPSLWNVAYNRWYFWDGRADSLWSQALDPLEQPREHAGTRMQYARLIFRDASLRRAYERVFGPMPDLADESRFPPGGMGEVAKGPGPRTPQGYLVDRELLDRVFANMGKAIAAYQRKIVSRRAPFDVFVEGLRAGNASKIAAMPLSAQRGLKLFIGRGNCRSCHHGPNFTDGEFHDTGVSAIDPGRIEDEGRMQGIARLAGNRFNSQGVFNDEPTTKPRHPTAFLANDRSRKGQFKTPSLRNVAVTAPYMHRGQFATLGEVLAFYSTLSADGVSGVQAVTAPKPVSASARSEDSRLAKPDIHAGETEHVLTPLHLSKSEADDLRAFLEALTDTRLDEELMKPPASPELR